MKSNNHKTKIRIPNSVYIKMLTDLNRKHTHAAERVGFLFTRTKATDDGYVIVALDYTPVKEDSYIEDFSVGAKIDSHAIRGAMQYIYENACGCFHVHLHNHKGAPSPSSTDKGSLPDLAKSFSNIASKQANGFLILSKDSVYASVLMPETGRFIEHDLISIVGHPMKFVYSSIKSKTQSRVLLRQQFLGAESEQIFKNVKIGIVGYGGGGSHIGQQLSHLGVEKYVVFDGDNIDETNLNRNVGASMSDVKKGARKTAIAKASIRKVSPKADVKCISEIWQKRPDALHDCDIVFGCVDTYSEREQLEAECRRYLIPYIDIGMDVHKIPNEPHSMSGQIIMSLPGHSCMRCSGYLTEEKLSIEAAKYGNTGGRPQVVWSNGVLASTAVGVFVDLVTGWTGQSRRLVYLEYDGNSGIVNHHIRGKFAEENCTHYKLSDIGSPLYKKI